MAMAWWKNTGIYSKMEADIKAEYGSRILSWTRPKFHDNIPLSFSHILPSFIFYGFATLTSVMALLLEISQYFYKKQKRLRKDRGRRYHEEQQRRIAWDSPNY